MGNACSWEIPCLAGPAPQLGDKEVENHPRNGSVPPAVLGGGRGVALRTQGCDTAAAVSDFEQEHIFIPFDFFWQAVPAPSFKCRNCGQLQRVCLLPIKAALERSSFFFYVTQGCHLLKMKASGSKLFGFPDKSCTEHNTFNKNSWFFS